MSLAALNRSTLREQLLELLRQGILDGTFTPGERMAEVELATRFGVSRGTVREALRTLHNSGLLEGSERNSLYVRQLSRRDIEELYEVRLALEGQAVVKLLSSSDAESMIEKLEQQLPETRETMPYPERFEIDLAFHEALVATAGNNMLLQMWSDIKDLMRIAALATADSDSVALMTRAHHQPIVDALREHDADKARDVLRVHMESASKALGSRAKS